jgi:hypothetical protein
LRHGAEPVRAGNDPGGAVAGGEVIKQPDRVADLVVAGLGRAAPVCVQVLMTLPGQRGPEVQRGKLEVAQHVGHACQHPRIGEARPEHLALVDQVGQPGGTHLLMNLDPGLVALGGQQLSEPGTDRLQLRAVEDPGQRRVAVAVEPPSGLCIHGGLGDAKLGERGDHIHGRNLRAAVLAWRATLLTTESVVGGRNRLPNP